jgi:predicted MFS family arabinose efflux permease
VTGAGEGTESPASPAGTASSAAGQAGRWGVALAGAVALAVAMGIGRFAFTPVLPMMLHDGVVDLPGASWLATANYLGYLVGALACTFQPWLRARLGLPPATDPTRLLRAGLIATGLVTLGMALPLPGLWPLLRFAAGVASAVVFVNTSGWCLAQLSRRGAPGFGGVLYAGPGAGIVASGLMTTAMVAASWRAASAWLVLGVLAFGLSAVVWRTFDRAGSMPLAAGPTAGADEATGPRRRGEIPGLALAYGIAGFGYIVTATFLPVIARQSLPAGSVWLDLFWPLFGAGVCVGALLSSRLHVDGDLRRLLAAAYAVQAVAIALGLWSPTRTGFALGSLLLGLPFTAITFFVMQEVRRLRPASAASYMGLLTAMYGIGQIAGPPLVAMLLHGSNSPAQGFTRALQAAMGALVAGAMAYLWLAARYPAGTAPADRVSAARL